MRRRRLTKALISVVVLLLAFLVVLFVTSVAYRVPSSAMEPTFHCADPGSGCEADHMDRVLVSRFSYDIRDPHRSDVAAFTSRRRPGPPAGPWARASST
jgi:signal peptidase I